MSSAVGDNILNSPCCCATVSLLVTTKITEYVYSRSAMRINYKGLPSVLLDEWPTCMIGLHDTAGGRGQGSQKRYA